MRGTDRAIKQVRKSMELGISRLGGMHVSVSVHIFGLGFSQVHAEMHNYKCSYKPKNSFWPNCQYKIHIKARVLDR